MQLLTVHLLKVIICSGLLLVYYRLALRNKRFHYYNRFYLLVTVVASLLLPLLQINWYTVTSHNNNAIALLKVITVQGGDASASTGSGLQFWMVNWRLLALAVYIGIGALLLVVLLVRIYKIFTIKKQFGTTNMAEFDFINTNLPQAPFSYLRNLFWRNDIDINGTTGQQILRHELTHIRQKHTWDKLWMHIATSVCWVNPFFWFIQKELHMLHEFIADEKAIENNDGAAFAAMLLTSQFGKNMFSPAQQFSYSPIKRRLLMLTNLTKPRYSYARRLMVLPLLATVVLLFAFKLQKKQPEVLQTHTALPIKIIIDAGHGGSDDGAVADGVNEKDITLKIANKIKELSTAYGVEVLLTRNGDYAVDNKERITFGDNEKVAAFISIHADYVTPNIKPSNAKEQQGIEALITKQNAHYSQSALLGSAILHSLSNNFKASKTLIEREQPAYIISHNNLPALLLECGWMNNTSDLKQMTDDATVDLMAKKILEGVVAYANNNNTKTIISFRDSLGVVVPVPMPLFVLNGNIVEKAAIDALNPNDIESMDVLKRKTLTDKYGDKGVNGVIEVITKKAGEKYTASAQIKLTNPNQGPGTRSGVDSIVTRVDKNNSSGLKAQPLYVLDGKIIGAAEFKTVDPNSIESVNVLMGKTATEQYGDKGVNGVIEISLKKAGSNKTIVPKATTSENKATKAYLLGSFTIVQSNGDTIHIKSDSLVIDDTFLKNSGNKIKDRLLLR